MAEPNEGARIDGLFELAFRRHEAGDLREAEQLYRTILEADPRQLDALHFLGMIALKQGDAAQAVSLIGQAIAANDKIAAYHAGIGAAHAALGEHDKAIAHYRKVAELDPSQWAAVHQLASLLLLSGNASEALEFAKRALTWKDTEDGRALFAACIRSATSLPNDPVFRALLTRALSESWTRPVELAGAAVAVIKSDPTVAQAIENAMKAWPARLSPHQCGQAIQVLSQDDLLRAVMDTTPVPDAGLERLLTSARTILLDAAVNAQTDISREMMAFSTSLARQCFINDYVFDASAVEREAFAHLRGTVANALTGRSPVFAIHIIALASFAPLHLLDRDDGLRARKWPDEVAALIDEQVNEPKREAQLRAAMPKLTDIIDDVSVKVRAQYEESPYPRWTKIAPAPAETGIVAAMRATFPRATIQDAAEPAKPAILIAGCGTGQQSIRSAQRFPDAQVLAVDLSLASLGYAQRKSTGLSIDYAQADIVELASLDRRFDLIESSGVLHHLADPARGWRALLGLLKPGGFMRIGLYSALARADIAAVRKVIAERGIASTAEAIRRYRQELISQGDARFRTILSSPDFFATSTCRDLLFHEQEHHFTLPQIGAFLTEHGLTLLGFELEAPTLARYHARFPDDAAMTDLTNWHDFETANPDTFGGMYNFYVQKPV